MTDTARPLPIGSVAGGALPPPLPASPEVAPPRAPEVVASYGRRCAAAVVDAAIAAAAGGWAVAAAARPQGVEVPTALVLGGAALAAAVAVVQWALHGRRGWTLGRLALGIRTLDAETHRPIGMGRVLLRGLVVAAGGLVAGVGALVVLLSPLLDRTGRRRGWHDRAARDVVLRARANGGAPHGAMFGPAFDHAPGTPTGGRGGTGGEVVAVAVSEVAAGWPWRTEPVIDQPAVGEPALRSWAAPKAYEMPAVTGSLRLAPLAPQRSGPDLDTRAIPLLRPADLAGGSARPTAPAGLAGAPVRPADPVPGAPLVPSTLDPELELTHRAVPGAEPVDDLTVPLTGPETAEIELSDGRRLLVERTALVGRNPVARTDVQTIRVHDPNRSVSKTHLQLGVEPSGVWVADRGSTNGTVVTLPDGGQVLCGVDQRVRLRVGATVVFGDCALRLVRGPGSPPVP